MRFSITFEDATTVELAFNPDLANTQQLEDYVLKRPELFPLRFPTAREAQRQIQQINRLAITSFGPGDRAYINLRFWNADLWYDSLQLPVRDKIYVCDIAFTKWDNRARSKIEFTCSIYTGRYSLSTYMLQAYVLPSIDPRVHALVTPAIQARFTHPARRMTVVPTQPQLYPGGG